MDWKIMLLIVLAAIGVILIVRDIALVIKSRKAFNDIKMEIEDDDRFMSINGVKINSLLADMVVELADECGNTKCNECLLFGEDEVCKLRHTGLDPLHWHDEIVYPALDEALDNLSADMSE